MSINFFHCQPYHMLLVRHIHGYHYVMCPEVACDNLPIVGSGSNYVHFYENRTNKCFSRMLKENRLELGGLHCTWQFSWGRNFHYFMVDSAVMKVPTRKN